MNKKLGLFGLLLSLFIITGCDNKGKEEIPDDQQQEEQQGTLTATLVRTTFVEGEKISKSDITVTYTPVNGEASEVTDYRFSLDGKKLTTNNKKLTITYNQQTFDIEITVLSEAEAVESVVFNCAADSYVRGYDLTNAITYKKVYSTGASSDNINISSNQLEVSVDAANNKAIATATIYIGTKTFEETFELSFAEKTSVDVKGLLELEVGTEATVKGVIAGFASVSPNEDDVILYDNTNGVFVGVSNMSKGRFTDLAQDFGALRVGDEVVLDVILTQAESAASNGNSSKVYAQYTGGNCYNTVILSRENQINYDKVSATTIDSQEALANFVSQENLVNNQFKLVKIVGKVFFINYNSFSRFFLDPTMDSVASYRISGNAGPVISDEACLYTTGKSVSELVFGESLSSTSWSNPLSKACEIYALYVGGNSYYYSFAILSENDVNEIEPQEVARAAIAPTKTIYQVGEELDLTGAALRIVYDYKDPIEIPLTNEMLVAGSYDKNLVGEQTVKFIYEEQEYSFKVNVLKAVESISITLDTPIEVEGIPTLEQILAELGDTMLNINYTDLSTDTIKVDLSMLSVDGSLDSGENTIIVTLFGKTCTFNVTVTASYKKIADIATMSKGDEELFKAVVVAHNCRGNNSHVAENKYPELIVKDLDSNALITLRDIDTSLYTVGDVITFKARVSNGTEVANKNMFFLKNLEEVVLVEHTTDPSIIQLDLTQAIDFESQEAFTAAFDTAAERTNMYCKLFAIHNFRMHQYDGGSLYRFYGELSDGSRVAKDTQYFQDNLSPVVKVPTINELLTQGQLDSLLGCTGYTAAYACDAMDTVYMVFVGGTGAYYADFVILGDYCIENIPVEPVEE